MKSFNAILGILLALSLLAFVEPVIRSTNAADLSVAGTDGSVDVTDPHAAHKKMLTHSKRYQVSQIDYPLPDVKVTRMSGEVVSLADALNQDRPVILSFIFTSCTSICPVLTATLAQAQHDLAEEPNVPRMVSVSIDPEYDSPEQLQQYAVSYRAGPNWDFLTGDRQSIVAVQRAFDAYRGDKMNHIPLTFIRGDSNESWVRLEGFTTAAELVEEYRNVVVR